MPYKVLLQNSFQMIEPFEFHFACDMSIKMFMLTSILKTASISPPAWDQVGFLTTTAGTTKTVFGVFGECVKGGSCSRRSVGYDLIINGATFVLFPSSLKTTRKYTYTL